MTLYVVGDVHGHLAPLTRALRGTGLLDEQGAWTGGDARLWFLGDLTDRGPDGIGVIDLIRRLQAEAAAAGGEVGCVIGNHDMLLYGSRFVPGSPVTEVRTIVQVWALNGGQEHDLAAWTSSGPPGWPTCPRWRWSTTTCCCTPTPWPTWSSGRPSTRSTPRCAPSCASATSDLRAQHQAAVPPLRVPGAQRGVANAAGCSDTSAAGRSCTGTRPSRRPSASPRRAAPARSACRGRAATDTGIAQGHGDLASRTDWRLVGRPHSQPTCSTGAIFQDRPKLTRPVRG